MKNNTILIFFKNICLIIKLSIDIEEQITEVNKDTKQFELKIVSLILLTKY